MERYLIDTRTDSVWPLAQQGKTAVTAQSAADYGLYQMKGAFWKPLQEQLQLTQAGQDLLLQFEGGELLLQDFFGQNRDGEPPRISLPETTTIDPDLEQALQPHLQVEERGTLLLSTEEDFSGVMDAASQSGVELLQEAGVSASPAFLGGTKVTVALSGLWGGNTAATTAVTNYTIEGDVVAGPLQQGHGITVQVYQADSTTLLTTATVDQNGHFSASVGSYTGVVILKAVDQSSGGDFLDESTGQLKDVNVNLMAVGVAGSGVTSLNVNPLTTIAAEVAGVSYQGALAAPLTTTEVGRFNQQVADLFGVEDLHTTQTLAVNSSDYSSSTDTAAKQYGDALAALSGQDDNNGGDMQQTIDDLVAEISDSGAELTLSTTGQTQLISGATQAANTVSGLLQRVEQQVEEVISPTVSVVDNQPGVATGDILYTITFSKPVTGFTAADVQVAGGTKGDFAGSGDSYTLVVQPNAGLEGEVTLDIAEGVAVDGFGNENQAATTATQKVDNVVPTLTISDNQSGTATGAITYSFSFSETVTGFTVDDITVTNGIKGTLSGSGESYTLTVTPDSGLEGNVTVAVDSAVATDSVGNSNSAATTSVQAVDNVAPSVTISDNQSGTATGNILYTFTFSETVIDFSASDINVTNGTKGTLSGSGDSYTLTVTPDSGLEGNVTVAVDSAVATDTAGNSNSAATPTTQAVDTQLPSLVITNNQGAVASGEIVYTFTFSEAVTDFSADEVVVTNGDKGALSGSGTSYSMVITPTEGFTGNVTVDVDAAVAEDQWGNGNIAATTHTQSVDMTVPGLSITNDQSGVATGVINYSFEFTESVTGFAVEDIVVVNGSKGTLSGSGASYTLPVTPDSNFEGDLTLSVAADVAEDSDTNGNYAAADTQTCDTRKPAVTISDNQSGTATGDITYSFSFSEEVTGFTADDITVTNGSKGAFSGSGDSYTLEVTSDNGLEGNVTVAVDSAVATDSAGNGNSAATPSVQAVDNVLPTVTISDNQSGTATGDITYTFSFSESVTGFTVGDITVTKGTKGAFSGSGDSYTLVVTPDSGLEGDVTVGVNSAVAIDSAGNSNSAATTSTQVVDNVVPTVTISDNQSGIATGPITYTFSFSESMDGFSAEDVTVTNGSKGTFSGSGDSYTLIVTPDSGLEGDVTVEVDSAVATDSAGNSNNAAIPSTQVVDNVVPTVTIGDNQSGTAAGAITYSFSFSEEVTGFSADDITVTNGSKGTLSGSGDSYTLTVTPDSGLEGNVTVAVDSAVATDAAGNLNLAATTSVQAVDTKQPSVVITNDQSGTASGDILYTFTFSETVTGFSAEDVTVAHGTKGQFSGTGTTYTLVVSPESGFEGDLSVSVAEAVAVDGVDNSNLASSVHAQAVDTQKPVITVSNDQGEEAATGDILYTFTLSEAVTGFGADDIALVNGSKGTWTDISGNGVVVYTLVVTPDPGVEGDLTLTIQADAVSDAVGNQSVEVTDVQLIDTIATVAEAAGRTTGSYGLRDTFTNLQAANSTVVDGATTVEVSDNGVSVANALVAESWGNSGATSYPLQDTIAQLLAADFSALSSAQSVTASDIADASEAIQLVALSASVVFDVTDTANSIIVAGGTVMNQARNITITLDISAQQAEILYGYSNSGTTSYSINDLYSNIVGSGIEAGVFSAAQQVIATGVDGDIAADDTSVVDYFYLASGASLTATVDQHAKILLASGTTSLTMADSGIFTAKRSVEEYQFFSGDDTVTMSTKDADYSMDLTSGGQDTLVVYDMTHQAEDNKGLSVSGFSTGVGEDVIDLRLGNQSGGVSSSSYHQVDSGAQAVVVGNHSTLTLFEVSQAVVAPTDLLDVSDGGAVETALAAALGAVTNSGGRDAAVILYGSGASANQSALYSVRLQDGADAVSGNMDVDWIATFDQVVADSFVYSNVI
ncbi:MAG: hypothetical protein HOJ23_12115 [Gammaproteobacteria bacterium]|jgi:hypothetical protein|nr:hypothetical protein [Gammaproteobacteria bacterium]